ncbi:hypothetical protein MHBO_000256 [Bonamia ostreae]|uniref:Ubiquitin-like domain-containing protein n=1 Tax=Bonamia ostreae TaxID=126728 RepID=A0ABV2AFN6_9EUKA
MSLILRISHSSGMKRIDADLNDNIAIFQKKIESITGVNPQNQMLSTTSMGNPNFIDLENKSALLKDFNFKNGKILYLISDGQNISKMAKNESLFERSDKCQHDLKTRCPYCKAKKEVEIKKKCFHGDKGFCLNCSPLVNSKKKIRNKCYHKEDTFCNNCIPDRKLTKNEDRQILKEQNCFCSNSKQRCIYCSLANKKISDYADSKHISSYSKFLADKRDNCNHQKSSFDTKTKFCAMCKPEKIISYKIKQCKNHAPWPKGICSQCTPPTAVIKLQNYRHCDEVSVMDTRPLQKFISSWLNNPEIRKVCFLIGSYSKIETGDSSFLTRAEIQAIYLPPHVSSMNSVTFKKDPNFESVKKIAESAKLQIIGWAFTSIPRSDKKYGGEMFLSAAEIRQASKFQSSFCDNLDHSQFITMVISRFLYMKTKN